MQIEQGDIDKLASNLSTTSHLVFKSTEAIQVEPEIPYFKTEGKTMALASSGYTLC